MADIETTSAPATIEINDAMFCNSRRSERCDLIDREGISARPATVGVYQCKKHGSTIESNLLPTPAKIALSPFISRPCSLRLHTSPPPPSFLTIACWPVPPPLSRRSFSLPSLSPVSSVLHHPLFGPTLTPVLIGFPSLLLFVFSSPVLRRATLSSCLGSPHPSPSPPSVHSFYYTTLV
ncbi:hypothetical protein K438DRAFT_1985450 [Mycena galopus ATCC 62051]|nr:hypothetical protein K438DRAFT_1985450 [Mycena galopus ATCC 62051]